MAHGIQILASASMMQSTAAPSSRAGHPGYKRTLSWSSRATHPPGGMSWFPLSSRRSKASNSWFLLYPEVAHFSHPYTSSNTGRVLLPSTLETGSESRTQSSRASAGHETPTSPLAGSARGSCAAEAAAICARSALGFRAAGGAAICAGSARGSRTAGAGSCGTSPCGGAGRRGSWGGCRDQGPQGGVDAVDRQGLVVMGLVRWHLLDAG